MDQRVLWFILLLPALSCFDYESTDAGGLDYPITYFKTIGSKPDSTPLCEDFVDFIFVSCTIRTESGKDCHLSYFYQSSHINTCGSKFSIIKNENQTVFLYLTGLTPEDSGIYTCTCPYRGGSHHFNLNVTVEAPPQLHYSLGPIFILFALCVFILGSGLLIGFTVHRKFCRNNPRTEVSVPPASVLLSSLDQDEQENPYESLQQPASDVYQTISSDDAKRNDAATGEDGEDYENL